MTEYTSIRVSKEAFEKAQEMKSDNQTWNEYVTDKNRGGDLDELEDRIVTRLARETQADLQSVEECLEHLPERTADEVEGRLR